jgi:acetyltransferase-like isoleucine patch superfamily enzyme
MPARKIIDDIRRRGRSVAFDLFLVTSNFVLSLPGHALRSWWLKAVVRAEIGTQVAIQRRVRIRARGQLLIGSSCNINSGVLLDAGGGLEIGDLVNISPDVLILTTEHDPDAPGFDGRSRPVRIESRVWIASRAIVLPGASIGEGSVIAAGAVVRERVSPWTIVAGNPARVIGERSDKAQQRLKPYKRFLH